MDEAVYARKARGIKTVVGEEPQPLIINNNNDNRKITMAYGCKITSAIVWYF